VRFHPDLSFPLTVDDQGDPLALGREHRREYPDAISTLTIHEEVVECEGTMQRRSRWWPRTSRSLPRWRGRLAVVQRRLAASRVCGG
jgi:hypothetical protein